jgi:tetratricopeptide (TPR) repeat protein
MCLGESTTAVGGKSSYPYKLEEILNSRNIGIKFSVINKGVGGIDSTFILSHLEENLNRYTPDMVMTLMGINDRGIKYYEGISGSDTSLINKFRIYKLIRIIWKDFMDKFKKEGFYTSKKHTEDIVLPSNISLKNPYATEQVSLIQVDKAAKEPAELTSGDSKSYVDLADFYIKEKRLKEAGEALKKALELNPNNDNAYLKMTVYLEEIGRPPKETEEYFKKALEINPNNDGAYIGLGHYYNAQKSLKEAEETLKKLYDLSQDGAIIEMACLELGGVYIQQRNYSQAKEFFEKAININPHNDRPYRSLAVLYGGIGQYDTAQEYFIKAERLREQYSTPSMTRNSYRRLKQILDRRGIKLVCAQYPMRSIEPLKRIFDPDECQEVIFMDNEKIFKDALKNTSYKEYFQDMFAGDFGHCTHKGNQLIAENIANVILREVFHR